MTKEEMLRIVEENISRIENKDFNLYFFVLDTKGNPSSALEYIYQTAFILKERGYKVTMLHQENEFIGVEGWLGEKYASLPHKNIEKDNVEVNASDFLFIPEIFANVMMQTKNLPCKRVILVQNVNNMTEFMPVSQTLEALNITDAIVTTKAQYGKLKEYFPTVRTHIVSPSIKPVFRNSDTPRKLIINVIAKEQSDVNRIIKPFYWKNPLYKWVSFRDLRGVSQDVFAEALREAAITIWVDDKTPFGYSLLEALRCGGLVIAKVPESLSDWMTDEEHLTDSVIWAETTDDISDMLASVVRSWTLDNIPEEVYTAQAKLDSAYSEAEQERQIEDAYINGLFEKRLADFKEAKVDVENNVLKAKED